MSDVEVDVESRSNPLIPALVQDVGLIRACPTLLFSADLVPVIPTLSTPPPPFQNDAQQWIGTESADAARHFNFKPMILRTR